MHRSNTQLVALTMTVLMLAADASGGPCWTEMADAGALPGDLNTNPCGLSSFEHITGSILDGLDQDMFLIFIPDPALFVVRTDGGGDGGMPALFDTQLWLFTLDGKGVAANNDSQPMMPSVGSYIDNAGMLIPAPGFYYLAISGGGLGGGRVPQSADGDIFPLSGMNVVGPTGPGGTMPITNWSGVGAIGLYNPIVLEGAQFPNGLGAPALDGQNIPAEFGGVNSTFMVDAQTNSTGFGDQTTAMGGFTPGSEADALYVRNDNTTLYFGITGNVQTNANAYVIFIDKDNSAATGQNELRTQGVDSAGEGPFVLQNMGEPTTDCTIFGTGTLLPTGFGADYALVIDTLGGSARVFEYTLFSTQMGMYSCNGMSAPLFASRAFVGSSLTDDNNAVLERQPSPTAGYSGGFNNTNAAGVTATSGMGAASAVLGLELAVPLTRLGLMMPSGTIKLLVLSASGGGGNSDPLGTVHNQLLPPTGPANCDPALPLGLTPDLTAQMFVTHTLNPGNPTPSPLDGQAIPTTFGAAAQKATQSCPTSVGNQVFDLNMATLSNGSEINAVYVSNDCGFAYVGVTGNVSVDGNTMGNSQRLVLFVDSVGGGEDMLNGQAGLAGAVGGLEGNTLPDEDKLTNPPVLYDFAIEISAPGGNDGPFYVNRIDLQQPDALTFIGQADECLGDGSLVGGENLNGMRVAYNRRNVDGVTDSDLDPPATVELAAHTATRGFEMMIPLQDLGITDAKTMPDIRIWAYVAREDGFGSDQGLPSLRGQQATMVDIAANAVVDFSGDNGPNLNYVSVGEQEIIEPPCSPDDTAPIFPDCITGFTIQACPGSCAGVVPDFTLSPAFDQCSAVTVEQPPPTAPGTPAVPGPQLVTITATDAAGNETVCDVTLTLDCTDDEPPVIPTCGMQETASANAMCLASVPNFLSPPPTDNCGPPATISQMPAAGSTVGPGANNVTLTATDAAGNLATCSATFIVQDITDPIITSCAADDSVSGVGMTCSAVVPSFLDDPGAPVAMDNCGTVTFSQSPEEGSIVNGPGSVPITITATDSAGNTAMCIATLTVTCMPPPSGIPTVGEWGLIVMTLALLAAGAIVLRQRPIAG